jgi:hypothetical protein
MYKSLVRGVLAIIGLSTALAPTTSEACWLTNCFSCCKPKPVPTYCPPPVAACEVCPQQVSYVPQTCYRAVETCVPCTTCRAETVCDPCTGCPQTVMRPVTTYTRRQVMVPYTTYRPVVTPVAAAAPCSTCTGAAYNSPYYSGAAMTTVAPAVATAPAGCTNCAAGYTMPASGVPAAGMPAAGMPAYGTPPGYGGPVTTQPQLPTPAAPPMSAPSSSEPPRTFENGGTPPAAPSTSSYQAIPDAGRTQNAPAYNGGAPTSSPALLNPDPRTTARPMYRSASILPAIFGSASPKNNYIKPVSATRTIEPAAQPVDDGWRPLGGR